MSPLEHTDPAFAAYAPALTATEPALPFVCASGRRFPARARQNHASDAACQRRIFVLGGGKAAIGGGDMRRAAEDVDVSIERRRPRRDVRGRRSWTS